jgi:hypothetical protein
MGFAPRTARRHGWFHLKLRNQLSPYLQTLDAPLVVILRPYAISDLTTNNTFAGRSANRRMYQGYHAEP